MTTYYVTCRHDDSDQTTVLRVSAYDVPEASLKATAQARRENGWRSVSSIAVELKPPLKVQHLPDREQRQPRPRMAARGSAVSDRGDVTLVQEGLGI